LHIQSFLVHFSTITAIMLTQSISFLPIANIESYEIQAFGTQAIPAAPARFGFQVDVQADAGMKQILFGLISTETPSRAQQPIGFGVRIDLERGEIWDAVNDTGLVGWLEEHLAEFSETGHILLSLEIERTGNALLPKLQVGGEEWLYPAVRSIDAAELSAIAGFNNDGQVLTPTNTVFSNPSLWSEQKSEQREPKIER
jgi:hypothetical protein